MADTGKAKRRRVKIYNIINGCFCLDGKSIVFFNLASLSKIVNESSEYNKYNNCIVVNEVMSSLPKYKQYLNYVEAVYQNNGLVEDKTDVMIDIYLSVLEGKEIIVKDLLGLGVN